MAVSGLKKGGYTQGGRLRTGTPEPPPTAAYWQPPDPEQEDAVLAYMEDQIDKARRRDYPWHALWYLVAANFVGRQWATFNPRRRALEEPIVPANKILLTLNQILPMVLREASKLSLGRIPWTVVPTSLDEAALDIARMEGKLLEHFWEVNGMRRWEGRYNLIRALFGMAYIEPDYDLTLGKMTRPPMAATDGSSGRRAEYEGGVTVRLHTPFSVTHDPDATEPDDLRWIAITKMTDVGRIRQMYDRGDEVVPEQPDEQTYLEHRMQYLSSHYFQAFTARGDYDRFPHHANLVKFWFYPDDKYPMGREIHKAGRVILYDGQWRHRYLYEGSRRLHPVVVSYYTQVPGRFKGQGMVENLLEPQWEYNKKRSQFVEILNRMAKPKYMAAKGHKMPHAPDDEAGELIEYYIEPLNPTSKPEVLTPAIPTGDYEAHNARTMSDMQNTASQHEVSYGRTPPGVSAGVAIEQLIAQDDAAKGLPVADGISSLQEVGYAILGLYRQFGPEEMVISLAGKDYIHEFLSWKKSMSNAAHRVHIVSDGSLPLTRGQKREMVKELIALQILNPLEDRNKILQYLEFGQLEEAFHQLNQDLVAAKRENQQMLESDTLPQVYMEDDHEVHIIEHTDFLKARRELDPMVLARVRTHIKMHLFHRGLLQQQTAAMAAQASVGLDMAAERVGDDTDRILPNEEAVQRTMGGQGGPQGSPGPVRPESGAIGKRKTSGTPGNVMRERQKKERV